MTEPRHSPPYRKSFSPATGAEASVKLSWELVKITRKLSVEDQNRVLQFARSLAFRSGN